MNIFILDLDPEKAAQYHNDKHVIKMILETTQILCTVLNNMGYKTVYRSTHQQHPCTKWAAKSYDNFKWLKKLGIELCKEYSYRYGKTHKCQYILENLIMPDINKFCEKGITKFVQAMPPEYKNDDPVKAYRDYYIKGKKHILKYTKRNIPYWLK